MIRTLYLYALAPLLLTPLVPQAPQQDAATSLPTANDAIRLAKADSDSLDPAIRLFQRYVWVPKTGDRDTQIEEAQAIGHLVNAVSRAANIARPLWIGKGDLLLLRIDIREYASKQKDLKEWLETWEELRFDTTFQMALTKDMLASAEKLFGVTEFDRANIRDGKIETDKVSKAADGNVLRVLAPEIDNEAYLALMNNVVSTAPIVSADYLTARALASIEDKGKADDLWFTLYGGLYYRFADVPGTLDELLEQLGVGSVKGKIKADDLFNDVLRTDARVGIARSNVLNDGRERRFDILPTLGTHVTRGQGIIVTTFDLLRSDFDVGQDPIANLLKTFRNTTFHEVLFTKPNGLMGASLNDQNFKRAEVAPPDLVKDHSAPEPQSGELQSIVSCMACHDARGHGGWIKAPNDVQKLTATDMRRIGIPFDLSQNDQTDAADRIRGLFSGDAEAVFRGARDSYARAVLDATTWVDNSVQPPVQKGWKRSVKQNADVVELSSGTLVKMWRRQRAAPITPQAVLREAGWEVPEEKSQTAFNSLTALPPSSVENSVIALLRAGVAVNRVRYDLARHLMLSRIQATLKANPALIKDMQ